MNQHIIFFSATMAAIVTLSIGANYAAASYHEPAKAATTSAVSEGEVKKINKDTGKITIKHGPLTNLDMPAMTMVFQVKDRAMLDQVKEGDKIKFTADKINGAYTVITIEP